MQESINNGLEEIKNKHTETNKMITEIKSTLESEKKNVKLCNILNFVKFTVFLI